MTRGISVADFRLDKNALRHVWSVLMKIMSISGFGSIAVIVAVLTAALFSGCAADKSTEDYRREQVAKETQKLETNLFLSTSPLGYLPHETSG